MKTYRKVFGVNVPEKTGSVNITDRVRDALAESEISDGLCLVASMHTSSAVYMTDADSSLTADLDDLLKQLVPQGKGYRHDQTDHKKNADGHLKCVLTGLSVTVPVTDGKLDLGTWQTVYYLEMDGGREKEYIVKIIGE